MAALLSRTAILKVVDSRYEDIEVPEWGGLVRVKALSGAERDQFEDSLVERGPDGKRRRMNIRNIRARLVALAVVDEAGSPLFQAADIEALGHKSAVALGRVFDAAARLAGIGENDLEEFTENFTLGQNGDSASG